MSAIGVFDSGVGGLTVLKRLRERWPGENFIYLADTARLPYGAKSLATISSYVAQNVEFLSRFDVKAMVVACNSASTAILERPIASSVPILNVIEPGARAAIRASSRQRIGVLGTRATVMGQAYVKTIRQLAPEAEVFQQACPLFVPLVEEGWLDDPITNLIVYRYVSTLSLKQPDTVILGCTHYPALARAIQKAFGPGVHLVDSAKGLIEDLEKLSLETTRSGGSVQLLCTDYSPRLEETVELLLGERIPMKTVNI